MEMFAILLVVAAARGLWEQTKRDLNQWRHRPPPPRSTGMLRRALRRLTAGGTGYWGHQAAHGFPTARAGLHDGWNRAREAHHQARRTIAQNRAEHAEGLAELRPELENLRERRRRALRELEEQRRRRWQEQQQAAEQERERAEAERPVDPPSAGPEVRDCYEHGNPLPCDLCEVAAGRGDDLEDEEPGVYDDEAQTIRDGFEYETCEICGKGLDRHRIARDPLGHAHAYCLDDPEDDDEKPEDTGPEEKEPQDPGPDPPAGTAEGDEHVSTGTETTYQGVKARMTSAQAAAEQRQAEAAAAQAACEERVQEAEQAKVWAQNTSEEMQALDVDAATLGAMAEQLEALDKALAAEQQQLEAATAANEKWAEVAETAGQVSNQLEASGHGQLDEAHANAAGGGAEKDFYDQ